eukprot:Skav223436  [mRNA]  locus=scaffold350:600309:606253:+ [translate_table: standard]
MFPRQHSGPRSGVAATAALLAKRAESVGEDRELGGTEVGPETQVHLRGKKFCQWLLWAGTAEQLRGLLLKPGAALKPKAACGSDSANWRAREPEGPDSTWRAVPPPEQEPTMTRKKRMVLELWADIWAMVSWASGDLSAFSPFSPLSTLSFSERRGSWRCLEGLSSFGFDGFSFGFLDVYRQVIKDKEEKVGELTQIDTMKDVPISCSGKGKGKSKNKDRSDRSGSPLRSFSRSPSIRVEH